MRPIELTESLFRTGRLAINLIARRPLAGAAGNQADHPTSFQIISCARNLGLPPFGIPLAMPSADIETTPRGRFP
jgi:hypothetical protein